MICKKPTKRAPRAGPLLVGFLLTTGCVFHKQVQYFAATSTETGVPSYYKMTICGSGGGGTDFHLQAGYFSAAAVDMLRGSMPDIPILDLPVEQLEVLDRLTQQFYAALIQEAKRAAPIKDIEAMYVATSSRLRFAEQRLGKLKADQADVERKADRIEKELLPDLKTIQDNARKEHETETAELKKRRNAWSAARDELTIQRQRVRSAETSVRLKDVKRLSARNDETLAKDANAGDLKKYKEMAKGLSPPVDEDPANFENLTEQQKKALRLVKDNYDMSKSTLAAKTQAASDADTAAADAGTHLKNEREMLSDKQGELEVKRAAVDDQRLVVFETRNQFDTARRLHGVAQKDLNRLKHRVDSLAADVALNKAARDAAEQLLKKLKEAYDGASFGELAAGVQVDPFQDPEVMQLARVIWFGSLSQSDIASMGMTQNTNPFHFRKLVLWATANNIDLNRFAGEIDMVIDNVIDGARSYQKIAAQRRAERKARRRSLRSVLDGLLPGSQGDTVRSLIDLMFPSGTARPAGLDDLMDSLLPAVAKPAQSEATETGG